MPRCLCGDTACPSCGPAQGFDPSFDDFVDEVFRKYPFLSEVEEQFDEKSKGSFFNVLSPARSRPDYYSAPCITIGGGYHIGGRSRAGDRDH